MRRHGRRSSACPRKRRHATQPLVKRGDRSRATLVLQIRPALLLLLRLASLLIEPAPDGRPGGPGGLARFRPLGRLGQHRPELLQAVGHVASGIAKTLAGHQQITLGAEAATMLRQQPLANRLRQAGTLHYRPAQQRLRVELVDVLPSRPRATGEAEPEFPQGFAQPEFSVYLPASVTSVTVPKEFMKNNSSYKYEVLAIEVSGNQTISAATFSTN